MSVFFFSQWARKQMSAFTKMLTYTFNTITKGCKQYIQMCWMLHRALFFSTRKMPEAVVSWGFHKAVCYHILIKRAPSCLHPFWNLSAVVLQAAHLTQLQPQNNTVIVHNFQISKLAFFPIVPHSFPSHLRSINQSSKWAQRNSIFLQRTNNIVFPLADFK